MRQIIAEDDDLTLVESAEDVHNFSSLDFHSAMVVMDVIDRRRDTRPEEQQDIIVLLSDWATADKYDIANSCVLLVSRIEDVSKKAYNIRGSWEFDTDVFDLSLEDARDVALNNVLSRIDKTDTEFVQRLGETYIPKSAVESILVYQ